MSRSLNLLNTQPDQVDEANVTMGQALADAATIGLLQQRAIQDSAVPAEQLQTALNSRLVDVARSVAGGVADLNLILPAARPRP